MVLDGRGVRAASMIGEGLDALGVGIRSPRDIYVAGHRLCEATCAEELRQACVDADVIVLPNIDAYPGEPLCYEQVVHLSLWSKTIVLDFTDQPDVSSKMLNRCLAYFKRSWPLGLERSPRNSVPGNLFPVNFAALGAFERFADLNSEAAISARPIDIGFYFSASDLSNVGSYVNRRRRVYQRLLATDWGTSVTKIGEHSFGNGQGMLARQAIAKPDVDPRWITYMRLLSTTKVVFTATPDLWDGDWRTWEALWSGACVFLDQNYIPTAHMPREGIECFYYDAGDEGSIEEAIRHAKCLLRTSAGMEELERVGRAGRQIVLQHHLARNRVEGIFDTIQSLR